MSDASPPTELTDQDESLRAAVKALECPNFLVDLADKLGQPVESLMRMLPAGASDKVDTLVERSLARAARVAATALHEQRRVVDRTWAQRVEAAALGAAGGSLGWTTLAVELPITTTLILRAIAAAAREQGEDPSDPAVQRECLKVFALGGRRPGDRATESAYFTVRMGLAHLTRSAMPDLLAKVAARFSVVVGDKLAAQAVPAVGALGGAAVNVLFMNHFQNVAFGHFTVRRLEREHGAEAVRAAYERVLKTLRDEGRC